MSAEGQAAQLPNGAHSPNMALSAMVSSPVGNVIVSADPPPSEGGPPLQPVKGSSSSGPSRTIETSHLETVREAHRAAGVSDKAWSFIIAGWRKRTSSTYGSAWTEWNSWCYSRGHVSFSAPVTALLDYLTELFEAGLEHGTINTARSAISMTHKRVDIPVYQVPANKLPPFSQNFITEASILTNNHSGMPFFRAGSPRPGPEVQDSQGRGCPVYYTAVNEEEVSRVFPKRGVLPSVL